jgi:alanine dehydrogenase
VVLISRDYLAGTLGEVVIGEKAGGSGSERITIFDLTGLAIQDLAIAKTAMQNGRKMSCRFRK